MIASDLHTKGRKSVGQEDYTLQRLATAYFKYQQNQTHPNFHGLRDYYSLIKCLSRMMVEQFPDQEQILTAVERNFGGIPADMAAICSQFTNAHQPRRSSVLKLIQSNLEDLQARHLMLITNSESAISILERSLRLSKTEPVIIYGSNYQEDQSEQYLKQKLLLTKIYTATVY